MVVNWENCKMVLDFCDFDDEINGGCLEFMLIVPIRMLFPDFCSGCSTMITVGTHTRMFSW